jgi:chromosome segregation ATPase
VIKKKLKKKEFAVRIKRLVEQYSDLNNRLNRFSHDKLNQGLQLDRLSEANAGMQQRLLEMQNQIEQVISQEEALSRLLESLRLQSPDEIPAEESSQEQQEIQQNLDDLNEQLATLHAQHQSFRHALEHDSQSADTLANNTDDLRRDVADLLSHIRRLEESGSELLVSDAKHESQIQRLQNDIAEFSRKLEQSQGENENSQQEFNRLLQEHTQPLQGEIEHFRHQLSEKGGQHKELERRLLELANRIGETGAKLESQQPEQQKAQESIDHLNEQMASLYRQHQSFRNTLEHDGQWAEILANNTDDLRRDVADLLSHVRRLEESGSELLVSDAKHESQIQRLQNDIAEFSRKLEQSQGEGKNPQQEFSRLLQENTQPLQGEIEHLRHQLSEKNGQQKELERRLLELANRIGETGAKFESQQQDKARKNEVLSQRLAKLEALVQDLQPVSNADASQLTNLEQRLSQAEEDMASLLTEKDRELTARLDSLDAALNEQASATPLIEEQNKRFEETARQLKQEISGLQEKMQTLDTDEHETADWLSSLAANLDQQAGNQEQLYEELTSTKSDFNRRVDEVKARLIISERQLKEQDEGVQDQLHQLNNLVEEMAEQVKQGLDLRLITAALQEDSSQLKENNDKLNERLDVLQRTQQQEEQKQTQITNQLSAVEQEQKELRELTEVEIDSLQERVKTALEQLAVQSRLNEGLSERLDDLESSLQAEFGKLDNRHDQLLQSESENRERLTLQEQSNHALSTEIAELKTDHQELLQQTEKQETFLETMTSKYGKRQEESEKMGQRLDQLGARVESIRSGGTFQGIATGGLLLLLLLSILFGYQYFSSKFGSVERDISLKLMDISENYLTKDEIEELMSGGVVQVDSAFDSMAVEALIKRQDSFEQRLHEIEQKIATSTATVEDHEAGKDQGQSGQTQAPISSDEGKSTQQPLQQMEAKQESLGKEFTSRIEQPDEQNLSNFGSKDGKAAKINQMDSTPQGGAASQDGWQTLRDRGGYTIQLIGVSNKEAIARFARKYSLQGEVAYVTTEREGRAWYVLLHGNYDNYTAALNALQALPEALPQQPWVRIMPNEGVINRL